MSVVGVFVSSVALISALATWGTGTAGSAGERLTLGVSASMLGVVRSMVRGRIVVLSWRDLRRCKGDSGQRGKREEKS